MSQPLWIPAKPTLRETEPWFRILAETTSTAIFVYRTDRILYANPACEQLTGYSVDELLTMLPWDLSPPDVQKALQERGAARLRGEEEPSRYETRILTKSGEERWIDLTSARIALDDGEPAGMATAVDVTERKLAEVALRESSARLELAQRVAGVVTWEWNLTTDEMMVSPHAAEVLGCQPEELWATGREFLSAVCPEDQERVKETLQQCLLDDTDFNMEIRILAPDGKTRWLTERGRALRDGDGAPTRLIGVAHDISTKKLGEERLRAIVEGTAATTGSDFLRSLVRHLTGALGMEHALITEVPATAGHRVRVLALWENGGPGQPFDYDLPGTPCEKVVNERQLCFYPSGAWQLFPEDLWMRERKIESYVAVPLFNQDDRPLGHMAVMSTKPVDADLPALSILKIFAARAAAEIERKLAEEALAQEKERAQVTLASIGDGVIRTDAEGLVDYLNPVAERLTGWTVAEASGEPVTRIFKVVDEATGKPLADPVARCLVEGRVIEHAGYSLLVRKDGGEFVIRDSVAPIQDRHGRTTGSVLVFKDVTQVRGLEREMIYLARHDPLTGLINRREFEKRLIQCLETARDESRLHALFYLDLDEFKVVNDTCGHLAGDEMLKQVTALLKSHLRKTDTLARLGGDEFGVLLEDVSIEKARELGDRLRLAVKEYRFGWEETIFEIGVSIGLVPITPDSDDIVQLLSAADAACYVAKEGGRNRMHEYQPDDSRLAERYGEMQWIHRIYKAFAEHRFCLYRQSIQPLGDTDEPPLCEVFIRMIGEDGRIAIPAAFIPAAERYHLIASIDRWVIHATFVTIACGTLSHGDTTRFAINLSGQSVGDDAFLEYVLSEVEATGISPERIFFEITETAAVGNLAQAMHFIRVLKELGFRFVLDDFGSGLSSFAYLKNLQVDFLKIDGGFVRDMIGSTVQRALVESIHQIGRVMGIRTIAESVEDAATLEALREIGVDYAQGYEISMPEPLI
jgi:diguanylate cyclase (GGDEF)-like protein/PAS domain S-box-containing protein